MDKNYLKYNVCLKISLRCKILQPIKVVWSSGESSEKSPYYFKEMWTSFSQTDQ